MIQKTIRAPKQVIQQILRRLGTNRPHRPNFREVRIASPVHIGRLISPLRYDIIARKSYFEFFREHRGLFERGFEDYVRAAMLTDYFVWFRDVACRRYAPQCLDNEHILKEEFVRRLKKSARLHDSYERNGFDPRHPIALWSGHSVDPSETHKRVNQKFYAGDGCHRIALLLLDGFKEIPPNWIIVRLLNNYKPIDNTFILIEALNLGKEDYYHFLSLAYADKLCCTKHELLEHLSFATPDKLKEVTEILQIDDIAWGKLSSNSRDAEPLAQPLSDMAIG